MVDSNTGEPKSAENHERWYVPVDDPDRWSLGLGGMPPLHLVPYRGVHGEEVLRLCEDETGLLVGPTDRRLPKLGVFSFRVRGCAYYPRACTAGDFRPGVRVSLLRQPTNPHDSHAVAICAANTTDVAGYVNKQKARAVARLLDAGVSMRAVSVRGSAAGEECPAIGVIAGEPALIAFLLAPRPPGAPPPAGPDA